MTVAIYSHPACLAHEAGPGHPDAPSRLEAVLAALDDPRFADLTRIEAPRATREQLARVHSAAMIESILDHAPKHGYRRLDADTVMSENSAEAGLRAAGAVCAAIDAVMHGKHQRAFCAVRPPGHHATANHSMGYCLFNSIAVGAAHALAAHGLEHVAIVDFDVHHGNGTQDIFWSEPRVLYASTHQWPLYPGTGARDERGCGNIVNVPLRPGSGSDEFRSEFNEIILPALEAFAPQLILISAGFDAHILDPLAHLRLGADDFGWATTQLVDIATRHADGRVVSSLEGGYSLNGLRESTAAHAAGLIG